MLYSLSGREKLGLATLVAVGAGAAGWVGFQQLGQSNASARLTGNAFLVHVAGAVESPKVVTGQPGMVVQDAIQEAGGATKDADTGKLNLAARLVPNSRLYVPAIGESISSEDLGPYAGNAPLSSAVGFSSAGDSGGGSGPMVNINTAGEAELDKLPGVGPVTARAILDHRNSIGRFTSVDQLLDVKGIGPKKLEKMRPYVTL